MMMVDVTFEVYVGLVAIAGMALGLWVATKLRRSKTGGHIETEKIELTARETEILQLLTQGLSNAEIADKLFLSLSTVKTHVSRLFVKMNVKSRTQALEKGNRLKLIL